MEESDPENIDEPYHEDVDPEDGLLAGPEDDADEEVPTYFPESADEAEVFPELAVEHAIPEADPEAAHSEAETVVGLPAPRAALSAMERFIALRIIHGWYPPKG